MTMTMTIVLFDFGLWPISTKHIHYKQNIVRVYYNENYNTKKNYECKLNNINRNSKKMVHNFTIVQILLVVISIFRKHRMQALPNFRWDDINILNLCILGDLKNLLGIYFSLMTVKLGHFKTKCISVSISVLQSLQIL